MSQKVYSSKTIDSGKVEKPQNETKRRRVTRACDTCRQKKVKCDGKQPCIHCTVYSYNCTYDLPNIRNKKNTGIPAANPQAIAKFSPQATSRAAMQPVASSNLAICQSILHTLLPKVKIDVSDTSPMQFDVERLQKVIHYLQVKSPGSVNLGELNDMLLDSTSPLPSPESLERPLSVFSAHENSIGREIRIMLPAKDVALKLIFTTWSKACVLFRFYHRPSLLEELELLYALDPLNYTDRQQKFLPFLYSILACGLLFSKGGHSNSAETDDALEDDGFKYFLEARKLIDITNVGDIISIQTIVMMVMYLQCSARLSTCYSYIGIALRSAVKEGLHRNLTIFQNSKRKLDPIEVDTRKRLFYTIYKMDIYLNSLLGLPRSIHEDEIDQTFPEELDDENITHEQYLFERQNGRLSSSGCANHHTKLMVILSHIVRDLYPIKVKKANSESSSIPDHIHSKVTNLESELKSWLDNLPQELRPTDPNDPMSGSTIPERFVLANFYLHLSFLNCQIMLYRPFIHFISGLNMPMNNDARSLIRGRNCIKIARLVVKLANKMIDRKLLVGTYWFSMYTIFFSIACLIYYFHYANYNFSDKSGVNYAGVLFDDDLNIDMIKKDIEIGKKVLDCLKSNSNASMRIYNILNNLFERLNRNTANRGHFDQLSAVAQKIDTSLPSLQSVFLNFENINSFDNDNNFEFNSPKQERTGTIEGTEGTERSNIGGISSLDSTSSMQTFTPQDRNPESAVSYNSYADKQQGMNIPSNPDTPTTLQYSQSNVDYMPGVIDTLDAQIFGRILPPYMLEKNVNQATNSNNNSNIAQHYGSSSLNDSTDSANYLNSLDYLDPFNPVS